MGRYPRGLVKWLLTTVGFVRNVNRYNTVLRKRAVKPVAKRDDYV